MRRYPAPTFRTAVNEFAHKLHKHLGLHNKLTVHWNSAISTAGINRHGEMYLADIDDDKIVSHTTLVKYCGFILHELCHTKWTDFSQTSPHKYVDQLHNAVEDAWIEHNAIDTLLTGNVESLLSSLVESMTAEAIATVQDWSDPRQYPFALAVYLRRHAKTKIPLAEGLAPIFAEAAKRLNNSRSSTDNLDIARWVYAQLQQLPQNPPQKPSEASQSGDQGAGEGEGTPDQENASEGNGYASAPRGEDAAEVEPTLKNDNEGRGGDGATFCEDESLHDADHLFKSAPVRQVSINVPGKLRHEVRRIFENTGRDDFQRKRKSGAVNVHALPLVGHTDRLFQRRLETEGIDSAVVICLDISGSMDGNRINVATSACAALLDTLKRSQVATALLLFKHATIVAKGFNDPHRKGIEALTKVDAGGGTQDYFAIRYAHQILSQRTEQRKICFVLSDGDGQIDRTRNQVEIGERMGITTIGLGIHHDVSNVYRKCVNIKSLADLGVASFKQIKLAA